MNKVKKKLTVRLKKELPRAKSKFMKVNEMGDRKKKKGWRKSEIPRTDDDKASLADSHLLPASQEEDRGA